MIQWQDLNEYAALYGSDTPAWISILVIAFIVWVFTRD